MRLTLNSTSFLDIVATHHSPGFFTINVPKEEAHLLPGILRSLETNLDNLGIAEVTVNLSSLEEVRINEL